MSLCVCVRVDIYIYICIEKGPCLFGRMVSSKDFTGYLQGFIGLGS